MFYFPIYWFPNHPNWLIFFRGVQTTNQSLMNSGWIVMTSPTFSWKNGDFCWRSNPFNGPWPKQLGEIQRGESLARNHWGSNCSGKRIRQKRAFSLRPTTGWWFGCHFWHFSINIGFLIIPIDKLIFFRGVAQPPTRTRSWPVATPRKSR